MLRSTRSFFGFSDPFSLFVCSVIPAQARIQCFRGNDVLDLRLREDDILKEAPFGAPFNLGNQRFVDEIENRIVLSVEMRGRGKPGKDEKKETPFSWYQ